MAVDEKRAALVKWILESRAGLRERHLDDSPGDRHARFYHLIAQAIRKLPDDDEELAALRADLERAGVDGDAIALLFLLPREPDPARWYVPYRPGA